MYVIATQPFKTIEEAKEELEECYDEAYKIYEVKEVYDGKKTERSSEHDNNMDDSDSGCVCGMLH